MSRHNIIPYFLDKKVQTNLHFKKIKFFIMYNIFKNKQVSIYSTAVGFDCFAFLIFILFYNKFGTSIAPKKFLAIN